ncbi:eaa protein [Salmonella enterica subsp. enterica serovar Virchow]|nr:eaa protein [Salmonella enterica]EBE0069476.1 eaa protein [Salmonella enterica]EBX2936943.1 eaa protein [Salmonella enterica subsp. enterica serovar Virchow]
MLPCPFCGSPAEHYPDGDMEGYIIMCGNKNGDCNLQAFGFTTPEEAEKAWNTRAALLQGGQPVSNRDELPYAQVKAVADLYALCWQSGEVVTYTPDPEKATIWINNYSGTCVQEYVKLERLQEALAGNSPVIPDDWVMVPKEPTQAMIKAWLSEVANFRGHAAGYRAALEAAPQLEVNRG